MEIGAQSGNKGVLDGTLDHMMRKRLHGEDLPIQCSQCERILSRCHFFSDEHERPGTPGVSETKSLPANHQNDESIMDRL